MRHRRDDEGSAVVEFSWLAILLMVPLIYLIVAVFRVQGAAYGVAAATRDAGRAFVTADSSATAGDRAATAAAVVLADQNVTLSAGELTIACSAQPCLTPGASVTIDIATQVTLPLMPRLFGVSPPSVTVSARHLEVVDPYSVARP